MRSLPASVPRVPKAPDAGVGSGVEQSVGILAVDVRRRALIAHLSRVGSCAASSATVQRSFFSSVVGHRPVLELAHGAALHEEDLARRLAVLHRERRDERRDVGGVPGVKDRRVGGA